jgi:hypothetical protein
MFHHTPDARGKAHRSEGVEGPESLKAWSPESLRAVLQPLTPPFEFFQMGTCATKLCWTCHSDRELSGWILRFPVGKNRLKADVLAIATYDFQQPMGFIWLAWKKRREGGFPGFGRGSWAAKYEP